MASLLGIGVGVLDRFPKLRFVESRFPVALQPTVDHPKLSDASKRKILNNNARRLYPFD
jgi:predicted TIM-barrel fold metal-dependent hydrolase